MRQLLLCVSFSEENRNCLSEANDKWLSISLLSIVQGKRGDWTCIFHYFYLLLLGGKELWSWVVTDLFTRFSMAFLRVQIGEMFLNKFLQASFLVAVAMDYLGKTLQSTTHCQKISICVQKFNFQKTNCEFEFTKSRFQREKSNYLGKP